MKVNTSKLDTITHHKKCVYNYGYLKSVNCRLSSDKLLVADYFFLFFSIRYSSYSSISSATFSLKSDILDSLSELSFSVCSRKASSVAKRFT